MSIALTADELAQIRADIADLLPDTGYILTISNTSDGQGGSTEGTVISGTLSCRMDEISGDESLSVDQLKPYSRYMLTLPYDTTITEQNRWQYGSNIYNVVNANTDQSWICCKRVVLEKI